MKDKTKFILGIVMFIVCNLTFLSGYCIILVTNKWIALGFLIIRISDIVWNYFENKMKQEGLL